MEAVEDGTHSIKIENQIGCIVGAVFVDGRKLQKAGPQTVAVSTRSFKSDTVFVDVVCLP